LKALLDVNVLIALAKEDHVHHRAAHTWFANNRNAGWATCPLTENGFVRVACNPSFPGPVSGQEARRLFVALRDVPGHEFWPDDVSLSDDDVFDLSTALNHREVADIYLLGLAVAKGGRLATFDRRIRRLPVRRADPEHLLFIPE